MEPKEIRGKGGAGQPQVRKEKGVQSIEEETDRREGKDRRCCLWDGIPCRTAYLAPG